MLVPLGNSAPSHTLSCAPVVSQLDYEDYLLKQGLLLISCYTVCDTYTLEPNTLKFGHLTTQDTPTDIYNKVFFIELLRQQKEKLSAQSSDDRTDKGSSGSLMSSENLLLRKLVMSSITQLAQIASESLYDAGYLEEQYDMELDLDEIDDNDKEVGAGGLKRDDTSDGGGSDDSSRTPRFWERGTERQERAAESESRRDAESESRNDVGEFSYQSNDQKVSNKIKKMSSNVKNNGRDRTLESLLNNLAVTAEYIESLEDTETTRQANVPKEISDKFETGEPGEREKGQQEGEGTAGDGASVRGPSVDMGQNGKHKLRDYSISQRAEGGRGHRFSEDGTGNEITAVGEGESEAGEVGEEGNEDVEDAELVREIEQQLEESLAQHLDTMGQYILRCSSTNTVHVQSGVYVSFTDIKVKIVTIPEDQLREAVEGDGESGVSERTSENRESDLSAAMSKLLDSLLVSTPSSTAFS